MKVILACPIDHKFSGIIPHEGPLATMHLFGRALIEHWLDHLATRGTREVEIRTYDHAEKIRDLVRNGAKWGFQAEVFSIAPFLKPPVIATKCDDANLQPGNGEFFERFVIDHLPWAPDLPLFESVRGWFHALQAWMPRAAAMPNRIGIRELKPGVWVGRRSRIARDAAFFAPCWVGENIYVGPGAVIGPGAILEDGSFVGRGAAILQSIVGRETYVGEFTTICNSIASGNLLINWQTNSSVVVPDKFLMCPLIDRRLFRTRWKRWFKPLAPRRFAPAT